MITIKSKSEIDKMKIAGKIVAEILEKFKEEVKPGITTRELDRIAEEIIFKRGANASFKGYPGIMGAIDYPACICASVNNEVVHGIPDDRRLIDGDIISIDVGVNKDGFHADAARTYSVGKIDEKAKRLIDVTEKSFYEGIKNAVEGKRITDISKGIQNYVEKNGYHVVRDYVGHGIGREMHEEPQIPNYVTKRPGPRIQVGMTLAIEPMVNIGTYMVKLLENKWTVVTLDGSLSAHYENTIVVTENGPVLLTVM